MPWYKERGDAYAKDHPGFSLNVLSTTLREHEQKLAAAMPTGTGPDLFDVGLILSINFIEAGLIKPNPPDIDKQFKSGAYAKVSLDQFTVDGKTYGLPILFSSPALFWNKAYFREAGLAKAPETFAEVMEYAKKLVKVDSTGKMTRSGISLRLSGQGSGIGEKWRFILEPAGGSLITQTPSGKWHQNYDNDAGRGATKFYIDAVQVNHVDDPKILHDADAFVSGNTAMLMREAWVIGEIRKKAPNLEFDVCADVAVDRGRSAQDAGRAGRALCQREEQEPAGRLRLYEVPDHDRQHGAADAEVGVGRRAHGCGLVAAPESDSAIPRDSSNPPRDMQLYVGSCDLAMERDRDEDRQSADDRLCRSEYEGPAEARGLYPQVRHGHGPDPQGRRHVRLHVSECRAKPRYPLAARRRVASASDCVA